MNPLEIRLPLAIINTNDIMAGKTNNSIISPEVLLWFKENSMKVGYKHNEGSEMEPLEQVTIGEWAHSGSDRIVFNTADNLLLFKMTWL